MNVLHIVPTYYPAHRKGGPIQSIHALNKKLVRGGVNVTVYATDNFLDSNFIPRGESVNVDGVSVYYFPLTFRPWEYSFKLHKALIKTVQNFDVVHITSMFRSASALGSYYSRKNKIPYIISPRGSLMKRPLESKGFFKKIYITLIEKIALNNAEAIHFTTDQEREEYEKLGFTYNHSIVIPNGIDLEGFKEAQKGHFRKKFNILGDKKILLFLGRLNWIKGLDTLIPAFAEVIKKEPKAVLVLAGGDDGGYGKNVKFLISKFQLEDKVVFTGLLTGLDKIAAFQESDLFVLPSYSENFGMAVVEAMYFGLPVVITEGVGIAPSVEKAEAGLIISKNEDELVGAILEILNNPEKAKTMGENGRKLVKEEFDIEKVAERWIDAYNELASQ